MLKQESLTPVLPPPFHTLILAGGRSTRMGQDKALLQWQGMPLLQYLINQVVPISAKVYVITPWPERYRAIAPTSCQFIQEHHTPGQSQGPLPAFAQGLTIIQSPWVLLLACDLPYLTTAVLSEWTRQLAEAPANAIALLAKHPKGWEPLCGFYRSHCRESLLRWLDQGGQSFQGWLATETVAALDVSHPAVLINCNTPQTWEQVKRCSDIISQSS